MTFPPRDSGLSGAWRLRGWVDRLVGGVGEHDDRESPGVLSGQLARGHGCLEPGTEIVERHDVLAGCAELAHDVAADIAGTAGYKYRFVFHDIFSPNLVFVPEM